MIICTYFEEPCYTPGKVALLGTLEKWKVEQCPPQNFSELAAPCCLSMGTPSASLFPCSLFLSIAEWVRFWPPSAAEDLCCFAVLWADVCWMNEQFAQISNLICTYQINDSYPKRGSPHLRNLEGISEKMCCEKIQLWCWQENFFEFACSLDFFLVYSELSTFSISFCFGWPEDPLKGL